MKTYNQEHILMNCQSPSGLEIKNKATVDFFKRYLLEIAKSAVKITVFPKTWDKDYFMNSLYCGGNATIVKTDKFGVIPQFGVPYGFNVFYKPYKMSIANPLLSGIVEPVIGKQCTVFKMLPDYGGIFDLVCFFADMMAMTCQSFGVNLSNSKLAWTFLAKDEPQARSLKKAIDSVNSGKPSVIVDKQLMTDNQEGIAVPFLTHDVRSGFIAPELFSLLKEIENQFCQYIGIPSANQDKRERLVVDEVNANNVQTYSMMDMIMEGWKQSAEDTVEMFGEDYRVEFEWRTPTRDTGGDLNEENDL